MNIKWELAMSNDKWTKTVYTGGVMKRLTLKEAIALTTFLRKMSGRTKAESDKQYVKAQLEWMKKRT